MKFMSWINGNKSLIATLLMLVINSDYVAGMIPDPQLYALIQAFGIALMTGGLGHKVMKGAKPKAEPAK